MSARPTPPSLAVACEDYEAALTPAVREARERARGARARADRAAGALVRELALHPEVLKAVRRARRGGLALALDGALLALTAAGEAHGAYASARDAEPAVAKAWRARGRPLQRVTARKHRQTRGV